MSLTYGYDLKGNDDPMIAAPVQATELLSRLILPGAVLVNHLPFCEDTRSVIPMLQPDRCLQCGISLPGFHGLTTSHWRREAENLVPG
jgi:hypothetical protein